MKEGEDDDSVVEDHETIATIEKQLEDLKALVRASGPGLVYPPETVDSEGLGRVMHEGEEATRANGVETMESSERRFTEDQ